MRTMYKGRTQLGSPLLLCLILVAKPMNPGDRLSEGNPIPPAQHPTGEDPLLKMQFDAPSWLHSLGRLVHAHRDFWLWLGQLETCSVAHQLARVRVRAPIYVVGLARSGSTLLHSIVCSHLGVATQRAKDYPMVFTPYWWRRATAGQRPEAPHERPHGDGIMIDADSPDSLEEIVWMAFFRRCHDPSISSELPRSARHAAFESFYDCHIRKLLLAEGASRYAAKNNYHVARLAYLSRLFPDTRFLLPVRAPQTHIASLLRQQHRFSGGQRRYPRALAIMRWSGHYEFGLDRRPIHVGDDECVRAIIADWKAGNEVRGLARYWNMIYSYLARLLASDALVRAATMVVRFETLCREPVETLRAVARHCMIPEAETLAVASTANIRYPAYYQVGLSPAEVRLINAETAAAAELWGYRGDHLL